MKIFFGASVLVPFVNAKSPHHVQAESFWLEASERATSCHALAGSYRTLTTLKHPLTPENARRALKELRASMELVEGTSTLHSEAMQRMAAGKHAGAMI
jgi:hypothetical protein